MFRSTCARHVPLAAATVAVVLTGLATSPAPLAAQESVELTRPIPGPVVPPQLYLDAIESGTRSPDGRPGPEYWQVWSEYTIDAKLDPRTGLLSGREEIRFLNRSPNDIDHLMLHLHQNLHAEGAVRNRPQEVTGGVTLHRVAVGGQELFEISSSDEPGYRVLGTLLRIQPPTAVEAGGEAKLEIDWSFTVPRNSSGRMGHSDREIYYIGYWFPKIGVYDDLRGWDTDPYLGGAEFYDSFGDYAVSLTVPAGWTVMATGVLDNAEEVLSEQTRQRLAAAAESDDVIQVASLADRHENIVTTQPSSGSLTYRFKAENVRDYTWTTSDSQTWDATSALVPDRDGDGTEDRVMIHSFWREDRAPLWKQQARYAKHAIEFLSRNTELSYPWPHMTSVEGDGIIGGGMEFPMLTLIGAYREREASNLLGVTVHELAHMWTPLTIGSNEKRHAWMDEGFASYLTNRAFAELPDDLRASIRTADQADDERDAEARSREGYLRTARDEAEGAMMQHGDYYEVGYGTASYAKPATLLVALRNLLGEEVFVGAVHTYFDEWAFKHPVPWDFFSTIERAAGMDLDWFWSSWYYETWNLDHAVASVEAGAESTVITIQDHGRIPMPAQLRIETSNGGTIDEVVPVSYWLTGATEYRLELPASVGEVLKVEIDPEVLYPDINRDNNVWPAEQQAGVESQP